MIFTDRTITIRNGKSTINEPVILYRGDFEVSIRFTIMESKFRFKSGVNLVDSEKASFGQLAILSPYGGNVFSEIVKCEDGTVTFTLTKEMIDQLEEVGLYSFQIRLFDYYRESRVSIPPVEFGIEVREPVASEDHDNTVNNAIVGYSIAKVVDGLNEGVPDAFDDNGNYNKTEWETGDRITEGKLNKIEDAIDKINQNEVNDKNALNKQMNSNFNVLSSMINTKADETEISKVQTQVNNLVLGAVGDGNNAEVIQARDEYSTLNDRLNAISSGMGIDSASMDIGHMKGAMSNNLYSSLYVLPGYIRTDNKQIENTDSYHHARIPVIQQEVYYICRGLYSGFASIEYALFYDANLNMIGDINLGTCVIPDRLDPGQYQVAKVTIPVGASYMAFNVHLESWDVRESAMVFTEWFNSTDSINVLTGLFGRNIMDETTANKLTKLKDSIKLSNGNLYNYKEHYVKDYYTSTNGLFTKTEGWGGAIVPVKENTEYSISFPSNIYHASRGHLSFMDDNIVISHSVIQDLNPVKYAGDISYVSFVTPPKTNAITFTLHNTSSFNDSIGTILKEGTITVNDRLEHVISIDDKPVLSAAEVNNSINAIKNSIKTTSRNIYRIDQLVDRALCNTAGNFTSNIDGWSYAKIPIKPNTTYSIYFGCQYYTNGRGDILFLDENHSLLSPSIEYDAVEQHLVGSKNYITVTSPDNGYFLCVTVRNPSNYDDRYSTCVVEGENLTTEDIKGYVKEINGIPVYTPFDITVDPQAINKPLYGQLWVVIGDSLTEHNIRATKNYHDYVAEDTGVTVLNYGKSGAGYKRHEGKGHAFYEKVLTVPPEADIITIFGSGNDTATQAPLGSPTDTGTDTLCGCMNKTLENLFSVMPGAKVGLVTPCPWSGFNPAIEDNWMALYSEALVEIGRRWSVPVLDLYHCSNLRPWDKTFRDLYYKRDEGGGTHPDEDGHKILANKFKMFIQSL